MKNVGNDASLPWLHTVISIVSLNNNDINPDMISALIDFINDVPDNLFPIDSNKIKKAIGDYKINTPENFDYLNDDFLLFTRSESKKIVIKDFVLKNNESLDIIVPKNEEFILSFAAFNIVMRWNMKNLINKDLLRFDKREGFSRYNSFYFKALKEGAQKLDFECSYFDKKDSICEVTLNITIK